MARWSFASSLCVSLLFAATGAALAGDVEVPRAKITAENAARLRQIGQLEIPNAYDLVVPDGGKVAIVVPWEEPALAFDLATLKQTQTLGRDRKLIHLALSPDGTKALFTENQKTAELYSLVDAARLATLKSAGRQTRGAFSPDGKMVATGGYDTQAQLWNARTGAPIRSFDTGEIEGALTPVFSPNGEFLAVGHRNATTRLFRTATGETHQTLDHRMSQGLKFDPAGKRLAVAYVDASLIVWDVKTGKPLVEKRTKADELYTVDWSPDGKLLVTAGNKGQITVWDASDLSILKELPNSGWVIRAAITSDSMRLLTISGTGKADDKVRHLTVWGIGEK
jgi:WD40 repeat protein